MRVVTTRQRRVLLVEDDPGERESLVKLVGGTARSKVDGEWLRELLGKRKA